MSQGDSFPPDGHSGPASRLLVPGAVLEFFDEMSNPPKTKKVVVVGMSAETVTLATVYINSRPAKFIMAKPSLLALQYKLEPDRRGMLKHTSYVDCTRLMVRPLGTLMDLIGQGSIFRNHQLTPQELEGVLDLLRKSDRVTRPQRRRFGLG